MLTDELIGHLINVDAGSTKSPVGGLHLDSAVVEHQQKLVANNKPIHLLKTADSPRTVGGISYNAFEQWEWIGGGTPGPRPTTPGSAPGSIIGGWRLAADPKTTFNDLALFLNEAEGAWNTWKTKNPTASGPNVKWSETGPGGQMIEGYVNLASTPIEFRTVYPLRTGGLASW